VSFALQGESSGFEVHLANFTGPFDLLLSLIGQHRMDVTEVSLAAVTDEFIAHLRNAATLDLDEATGFVVVAATLLDLKAARLLPGAGVEDEADLAVLEARDLLFVRLLQYRAFRAAADDIEAMIDRASAWVPRSRGNDPDLVGLVPDLVWTTSAQDLATLAAQALRPRPAPEVSTAHLHAPLVSVDEQREAILQRLRDDGLLTFHALLADQPLRAVVVARFLALLELYRDTMVTLEQDEPLGDVVIRWAPAQSGAVLS